MTTRRPAARSAALAALLAAGPLLVLPASAGDPPDDPAAAAPNFSTRHFSDVDYRVTDDGEALTLWIGETPEGMVRRLPPAARETLADRVDAANADRDPVPPQVTAMASLLRSGPMFFRPPDPADRDPFDPFLRVGGETVRNLPADIGETNRFTASGSDSEFSLSLSSGNGWLIWRKLPVPLLPAETAESMFGFSVMRKPRDGFDVPEYVLNFWTGLGVEDPAARVAAARGARPEWATRTREELNRPVTLTLENVSLEHAARELAARAGARFVINKPDVAAYGFDLAAENRSISVNGETLHLALDRLLGTEDRRKISIALFPYGTLGFSTYFHQDQPQPGDRLTASYAAPEGRTAEVAGTLRAVLGLGTGVTEIDGGVVVDGVSSEHWVADAVTQAFLRPDRWPAPAEAAARLRRELAD